MTSEAVRRAFELQELIYPGGVLGTVEAARAGLERFCEQLPVPADVVVEDVDAGGVPAEWVTVPESRPDRTLFYLHGGGFLVGSPRTSREMVAAFARAARARVLSVDYRLAPEHTYPAAHDDALQAYRWLLSTGCPPSQVAFIGDSAGGGLLVSTLVALRDAEDPLPAAGVLISPWLDLSVPDPPPDAGIDPWDAEVSLPSLRTSAKLYLGDHDPASPDVSSVYADLAGLPPLLVLVWAQETFVDESRRLARRAADAGVDVTLECVDDVIHVWTLFSSFMPEARRTVEQIGRFVEQRLGERAPG